VTYEKIHNIVHYTTPSSVLTYVMGTSIEEKVLVVTRSLDGLTQFDDHLPTIRCMSGSTGLGMRVKVLEHFEHDEKTRVLAVTALVATGFRAPFCNHMVILELGWFTRPILAQVEARCWRVGRTKSLLIDYLVMPGSSDELAALFLLQKEVKG